MKTHKNILAVAISFGLTKLLACSPTPAIQDAASNRRDAGRADNATATDATPRDVMLASDRDQATDSTRDDHSLQPDVQPPDVLQPDTAMADATQPDTMPADSAQPDTAPTDAYVFYGPFSAGNLPRPIRDADNNGSQLTLVAITVPSSLNANFVDFHVEIQHQDSRDLLVEVLPPTGAGASLYNGQNCTQNCSDNLVLEQREPVYNDTQGNWVLRVTDRNPGSTGTILVFSVGFAH